MGIPTASIFVSVEQRRVCDACPPHQEIRRAQLCHSKENAPKLHIPRIYGNRLLWMNVVLDTF